MKMNFRKNSVLLLKGNKDKEENDSHASVLHHDGGYDVTCVSVLGFEFVNCDQLETVLRKSSEYSCLVLTSPRAVEALRNLIIKGNLATDFLQSFWGKKFTFVVSTTTGKAAAEVGLKVIGMESGNSHSLSLLIIKEMTSNEELITKPVLFLCGNLKLEILPQSLHAAGITVECLTVYETSADNNLRNNLERFLVDKGLPECIIFYSPSGVNFAFPFLIELGFLINDVKLLAIGPSTEKAIKEHDFCVSGTSSLPTAEHLLELMKRNS